MTTIQYFNKRPTFVQSIKSYFSTKNYIYIVNNTDKIVFFYQPGKINITKQKINTIDEIKLGLNNINIPFQQNLTKIIINPNTKTKLYYVPFLEYINGKIHKYNYPLLWEKNGNIQQYDFKNANTIIIKSKPIVAEVVEVVGEVGEVDFLNNI